MGLKSYYVHLKISLRDGNLMTKTEIISILRQNTNQTSDLSRIFAEKIVLGKEVKILLKDAHSVEDAIQGAKRFQVCGFTINLSFEATGLRLPYLVDGNGIVEGSEPVSQRDLRSPEEIEAILDSCQVIQIGAILPVEWIPDKDKWNYWKDNVKPLFVKNGVAPNPGYFGLEHIAENSKTYLLIWYAH